jgi:hypothetical protein
LISVSPSAHYPPPTIVTAIVKTRYYDRRFLTLFRTMVTALNYTRYYG